MDTMQMQCGRDVVMKGRTHILPSGNLLEYCLVEPSSPTGYVILVPGMGNHRTIFELQVSALSERYALLLPDSRGIGKSSSPPGLWSIVDHANDILHLLKHAVPHWTSEAVHLVGHSMGGLICYEVMQRAPPGRIASLALLSVGLGLGSCCPPTLLRPSGLCMLLQMLTSPPQQLIQATLELNYPKEWLERDASDGTLPPSCALLSPAITCWRSHSGLESPH